MKLSRYNRKKAEGTGKTVILDLGGGLNEVLPPTHIQQSQLSASKNFYTPDGITLRSVPCDKYYKPFNVPAAVSGMSFSTYNGAYSYAYPSFASDTDDGWIMRYIVSSTGTLYDVSSYKFSMSKIGDDNQGCVEFITQANAYSVYWNSNNTKLLVQSQGDGSLSTVDLPSNVKAQSLVAHRNRLFLLDRNNTMWWCNAGDYTTWYGEPPDGEYQSDDAGYWFVDSEQYLNRIVSFGEYIYIFGDSVIYRFAGYSDETFALQKYIDGLGTDQEYNHTVAVSGGLLYFSHGYDIYEFNGSDYPRLISRPQIANGNVTNGISGGVNLAGWYEGAPSGNEAKWKFVSLIADKDRLYTYSQSTQMVYGTGGNNRTYLLPFYVFDIKQRSWWMMDGAVFQTATSYATTNEMRMIPAIESTGKMTLAVTMQYAMGDTFASISLPARSYRQYAGSGAETTAAGTAVYSNQYDAYFITKAFSATLDNEFFLYEVDILWKYAGEKADKRFFLAAYINDAAGFPYEQEYRELANYIQPEYSSEIGNMKCCENGSDWITTIDNNTYDADDDTGWQEYPHITKFYYVPETTAGYNNERRSGFFQFYLYVQREAIQIDRIELKYRAIGASR